jgi:hypothetical protein
MLVITRGYVLYFSLNPSILKAPFSAQGTRLPVDLVPTKDVKRNVDRPKRLMLRSAHQLMSYVFLPVELVELELLTERWQPLRGEPLSELQKKNRWIKTWVPMDQMDQRPWSKWYLFFELDRWTMHFLGVIDFEIPSGNLTDCY